MKRTLISFIALIAAGGPLAASAENIALVDTQLVLNDSIVGKAARNNLEGRIKKAQAKLSQMKDDFDKARVALEKQAAILSGSALETNK